MFAVVINEGRKKSKTTMWKLLRPPFQGSEKSVPDLEMEQRFYGVLTVGGKVSRWLPGIVWLLRVCTLT